MERKYVTNVIIIIYSNKPIWKYKDHLRKYIRKEEKEKERMRVDSQEARYH